MGWPAPTTAWKACVLAKGKGAVKLPLKARTPIATLFLLAGCATGQKGGGHTEAIESHVYALPLDDVLTQATSLLNQQGWRVERSGDQLGTNWRVDSSGTALGYRVEGERVDAAHSSIQAQLLAASSFAAPPVGSSSASASLSRTPMYSQDNSGGSGASGGQSTGWDGVDAPTTLGEPPPGMVTLPRGRDEALEWAVLQRLDPRSAQAIAHAETRRKSAASSTATPVAPSLPPPPPGCEPEPTGLEAALSERRLILLADVPGTNEIPDFVGRLACRAARQGLPTLVALELFRADQEWVDTYFASQGKPEDQAAFLQVARSFDAQNSGVRGSKAVLRLLDTLRALRDTGLSLRVLAFDEAGTSPQRTSARATTLERVRRAQPEALFLVVVEHAEAQTVLPSGTPPQQAPLGWFLAHWGLQPLALEVHSPGGAAWSCPAVEGKCTLLNVPATGAPSRRDAPSLALYPAKNALGFEGTYSVGTLTPSSPAR